MRNVNQQHQQRQQSLWSNYFLERVGFESKINSRRNLKIGSNSIGRSDVKNIDIGVTSVYCSRLHCVISVTNDSVVIENSNKSNGTTVNGIKQKMCEKRELHEGDTIGIVGGLNPKHILNGNPNFTVFRLARYTSNYLETIEIEDDDTIVISDDDESQIPNLTQGQ